MPWYFSCVQLRWELAERFVDIGGIVKHHCLNEDLDILVILFSCTTYLFRDSVVIHDIYWPDSIVLYDMHWPDYVVLYDIHWHNYIVLCDIYWPDSIVLCDIYLHDSIVLYDTIDHTLSSNKWHIITLLCCLVTTYIDLILSSYTTYSCLIRYTLTAFLARCCCLENGQTVIFFTYRIL